MNRCRKQPAWHKPVRQISWSVIWLSVGLVIGHSWPYGRGTSFTVQKAEQDHVAQGHLLEMYGHQK